MRRRAIFFRLRGEGALLAGDLGRRSAAVHGALWSAPRAGGSPHGWTWQCPRGTARDDSVAMTFDAARPGGGAPIFRLRGKGRCSLATWAFAAPPFTHGAPWSAPRAGASPHGWTWQCPRGTARDDSVAIRSVAARSGGGAPFFASGGRGAARWRLGPSQRCRPRCLVERASGWRIATRLDLAVPPRHSPGGQRGDRKCRSSLRRRRAIFCVLCSSSAQHMKTVGTPDHTQWIPRAELTNSP